MTYPTATPCRRTYAMIRAHCAVRTSTRIGAALRNIVGVKGDIAAMPLERLERLRRNERGEAQRLIALAEQNRRVRHSGKEEA